MTDRTRTRLAWAINVAIVLVLAAAAYQWWQCDGTFVRTLAWFRCMP